MLAVAEDERTPLLERFRYLAIVSANLDELYMSAGRRHGASRGPEAILARQQAAIDAASPAWPSRATGSRRWPELATASGRRSARASAASSSPCSPRAPSR